MALWVVTGNVRSNVLQHDGFTGFRRCHNQTTLAFTNWRSQIDHTADQIFSRAVTDFHRQTLSWKQGSQDVEKNFIARVFWTIKVNRVHFQQRKITRSEEHTSELQSRPHLV